MKRYIRSGTTNTTIKDVAKEIAQQVRNIQIDYKAATTHRVGDEWISENNWQVKSRAQIRMRSKSGYVLYGFNVLSYAIPEDILARYCEDIANVVDEASETYPDFDISLGQYASQEFRGIFGPAIVISEK